MPEMRAEVRFARGVGRTRARCARSFSGCGALNRRAGGESATRRRSDVERVVDQAEAERALGHTDVYEASDHLLGTGSALSLTRVVPEDIVRSIERESGKRIGVDPERYVVSHHGLRATGRITDESAELLDTVLDS